MKMCFSNFGIKTNVQDCAARDVGGLILKRNHGLIIQTERSHSLQPALGLGYDSHRTITIDGVAIFSQIPTSASVGLLLLVGSIRRSTRRRGQMRTGNRQRQQKRC
jgi:hypothetical protein